MATVLKELENLPAPAGVDASVFAQLKDELEKQLSAKGVSKLVSNPPTGEANRVDNLTLRDNRDGTYTLTWTYKNVGDYNQDGIVDIADITPLAENFFELANPENAGLDWDGSGVIDERDIPGIAENFFSEVYAHIIEGAEMEGEFNQFSVVSFQLGVREMTMTFTANEAGALARFRVIPMDSKGNRGEPSNEIFLPVSAPTIYSVTPTSGFKGETYRFTANVSGTRPLSYTWDFGGGAEPNLITGNREQVSAEVALSDTPGDYSANLTVTNAYGTDTFPFTLTVSARETWAHTWGGPGVDYEADIQIDSEGNLWAIGATALAPGILFLKYAPSGELLLAKTWEVVSDGTRGASAAKLFIDENDEFYILGAVSYESGQRDVLVAKFDKTLNPVFAKTWGGDWQDGAGYADMDEEGNIYIVGGQSEYPYDGDIDVIFLKYDKYGNLLFVKAWDKGGGDVKVAPDGNVYVGGSVEKLGADRDALLMKFTPEGEFLWGKTWGTPNDESAGSIEFSEDGFIYAGGYYTETSQDVLLMKWTMAGELVQARTWGTPNRDWAAGPVIGSRGNVFIPGTGWEMGGAFLLRFDGSLNLNRQVKFASEDNWIGDIFSLFADDKGNLYMGGIATSNEVSWSTEAGLEGAPYGEIGEFEISTYVPSYAEGEVVNWNVVYPEGRVDVEPGIEPTYHGEAFILKNFELP